MELTTATLDGHFRQTNTHDSELWSRAFAVLKKNDSGTSTKAAPRLYPHQWLWDSCFIAIGLRHVDIERAKLEVLSLLQGQWANGMIPHEIFSRNSTYHAGHKTWRSDHIDAAPRGIHTSGITQPPMIAEAIVRIGEKLDTKDRRAFYQLIYDPLIRYHQWLYRERDPSDCGLVTLIHSHETGMDNIPYWMELADRAAPIRVRALRTINQEDVLNYMRKDRKVADVDERLSAADIHTAYHLLAQLRRQRYELRRILKPTYRRMALVNDIPLIQDVMFNAILIRANENIRLIAADLGVSIPTDLLVSMEKAPHALETLFADDLYWSRNFRTGALVKEPTIATFFALYAGTIPQHHADALIDTLQQPIYWPKYGITTTPTNSIYFKARNFWQGPVWVSTNWLIAEGLERYGRHDLAERLRQQTLDLVARHGMFEYFSPLDGRGAGTDDFSWTAALTIDLLARREASTVSVRAKRSHAPSVTLA